MTEAPAPIYNTGLVTGQSSNLTNKVLLIDNATLNTLFATGKLAWSSIDTTTAKGHSLAGNALDNNINGRGRQRHACRQRCYDLYIIVDYITNLML